MKDRIVGAYLKSFRQQFDLEGLKDDEAFEHFVNYCIISKHHPDPFDPDDITVGGSGDLGLDGIGILVNDHLVFEKGAVDHLKRQLRRLDVQFIFIQSKFSGRFEGADIGTFIAGIRQFFQHSLPKTASPSLRELHALKEYIYDSSIDMDRSPTCRMYYATSGVWTDEPALLARINQGITDLKNTHLFSHVEFNPLDSEGLRKAYRELHNKIVREINFDKHTILPPISGVQEAYIGILPCVEYLKLLHDENGELNRRLFYDNVRDFQGHNPVNTEIRETVEAATNDRFALLNNGVTIVAHDVNKIGAAFRLRDFQIVNGCQTSHILFYNREHLTDKVFLPLKLIVTTDTDVTNQIIQGTNRQTEVKLEAFESLAPFQKKLEELFVAIGKDRPDPLYYERRSKQYDHLDTGRERIITLPTQINCFVGMFLNEPHSTHRYYGELLSSYRSRLFNEAHLPISYYVAALTLIKLERIFSRGLLAKYLRHLKYQIMMVFRTQNGSAELPPLNSKAIEKYCDSLIEVLQDDKKAEVAFIKAASMVESIREKMEPWREPPERTRAFTTALLEAAVKGAAREGAKTALIEGRVKWFSDVRGYGFVSTSDGRDAFLHQSVLVASGGQSVVKDQKIWFTTIETQKGFQVVHVEYHPPAS